MASKLLNMTIDELKRYIQYPSDNQLDKEEEELVNDLIDLKESEENDTKKSKKRSLPFSRYFDEMDLTDEQKKDRKELAEKMEDIMELAIAIITLQEQYDSVDELMVVNQLASDYESAARDYTDEDDTDWLSQYSQDYATDFVLSTMNHRDDEWFTSEDRATFNAENESNTVLNRRDFTEAKKQGLKHKEWLTMEDSRVRKTHAAVDRKVIPIDAFFEVGDALMLYPKDVVNAGDHPEEIANCRCSCRFLA